MNNISYCHVMLKATIRGWKEIMIFIFIVLLTPSLSATNYYVSSQTGNDTNDGRSPSTAWKTLAKVNSSMSLFVAGDSVMLERGSEFKESLVITRSGSASANLAFSAYGSGSLPKVKGSATVSGWTQVKTNVWQATLPNCPDSLANLFINGKMQVMGRQPNTGFYRITSTSGSSVRNSSLTFPTADYYKGANIAVKVINYIINSYKVLGSSTDGTIRTSRTDGGFETDHGFIIMNHLNTLDQEGEWCYDRPNNRIYLYTAADPSSRTVEVDFNRYGLTIDGQKYISVNFIEFTMFRSVSVRILNSSYIQFKNNVVSYSGGNGVRVSEAHHITFEGNTVNHSCNNGIEWLTVRDGLIKGNTIKNTALIPGKGYNENEQTCGIILFRSSYGDTKGGSRNQLLLNRIDSSGYNGISMLWNDTVLIKNNYITNSMLTLDDGGAIYYVRDRDEPKQREIKIIDNIIDYSYGNSEGTPDGYYPYWDNRAGEGIYLDNRACYALVQGNVVTRTCKGIYLHNGDNNVLRRNIIYDTQTSAAYLKEDDGNIDFLANNRVVRNQWYSKVKAGDDGNFLLYIKQESGTFDNTHVIDSNYYASPFYKDQMITYTYYNPNGSSGGDYNLQQWQAAKPFDDNAKEEPLSFTASKSSEAEYSMLLSNPSSAAKTFTLQGTYISMEGQSYSGQITLQPYTGVILFKDSRSLLGDATRPSGTATVCQGSTTTYTTTGTTEATAYTWVLNPAGAGTVTSNMKTATVVWSNSFSGNASLYFTVTGANNYTGTSPSLAIAVNGKPAKPSKPSGTSALTQGAQTITYTTGSVSGATKYNWAMTPSTAGTASGTTNSVNYAWSASFTGTARLKVSAENSCGISAFSDSLSIVVSQKAITLPAITGSTSACQGVSTVFSTVGVTEATSYVWKISPVSAGTITQNGKSASVLWANTYSGTVAVTYEAIGSTGSLGTSAGLNINILAKPAKPAKPTGTSSLTQGVQSITYSTTAVPGATKYNWTIYPAAAATTTGTTNSVSYSWNAAFYGNARLKVTAQNSCGISPVSDSLIITVAAKAVNLPPILGETSSCQGATYSYSTTGISEATAYTWKISPATAGTITPNGKSASIKWNAAYSGSVVVTYEALGAFGSLGTSSAFNLTVSGKPAQPVKPSGASVLTQGAQVVTYSTNNVTGATKYNWRIYPATSGSATGTSSDVNFTWNSAFTGTARLSVTAENSCGISKVSDSLSILVSAKNAVLPGITGESNVCQGVSSSYSTVGVANATSYFWKLSPSTAGTLSQNGKMATVVWNSNYSGSVSITYEPTGTSGSLGVSSAFVVTVLSKPVKPSKPSGATILTQGSQTMIYTTNDVDGATKYNWIMNPASSGVFSGTSSSVNYSWNSGFVGKAAIKVIAENVCGVSSVSDSLNIVVSPKNITLPSINGESSVCQGASASYSTYGVAEATAYSWKVYPANAGTVSQNGKIAVILWSNSYAGSASVSYEALTNSGSLGTSSVYAVSIINKPSKPGVPAGLSVLTPGAQVVKYTVGQVSGATKYTWTMNPVDAGTQSGSMNEISYTWNSSYNGTAYLTVKAENSCGASAVSDALLITVGSRAATLPAPTGENSVCQGTSSSYSTVGLAEITKYSWKLSPANAGSVSQGSTMVTVTWSNSYSGSAVLSYDASGSMGVIGTSPGLTISVKGRPAKPGKPSGTNSLIQKAQTISYSVAPVPDASSYIWKMDPQNSGILSVNVNSIHYSWEGTFKGVAYLKVIAENGCGKSLPSDSLAIEVKESALTGVDDLEINMMKEMLNPEFFVRHPDADITFYDVLGKLAGKYKGYDFTSGTLPLNNLSKLKVYLYRVDLKSENRIISGKFILNML